MSDYSAMSPAEADLLQKVNKGLPLDLHQRHNDLITKRRAETLTGEEYRELLRLTEQVETIEVRRVESLAELAILRGVSLVELMYSLGIHYTVVSG